MRLMKRHALFNSHDNDLRAIAYESVKSNCRIDEYIAANDTVSNAKKAQNVECVKGASQHIIDLKCQGQFFKAISKMITKSNIAI